MILKAGASGFLLKDASPEQLVAAVRAVATGDAPLSPQVTRRLIEEYIARPRPGDGTHPALAELTERETEVLRHETHPHVRSARAAFQARP